MNEPDLHHHGDRDLRTGLVDLAVNVRLAGPPRWLADAIAGTTASLGAYPDPTDATSALAQHHGVPTDSVLPTAGGAEAFTLIARGLRPARPLVVHPQFTEPEAALLTAGHRPRRHVLTASEGFVLDPRTVDEQADLLVVGNPTNPTGVLHPAPALLGLRRRDRALVVDEAFMDAVPGEPESLIKHARADLTGLLVVRSLTKTWGIAGLRAGYVVGDPALIADLRRVQPPWSVSTPALAATVACTTGQAVSEAHDAARTLSVYREHLTAVLTSVGLPPRGASRAPFVLVDTSSLGPDSVRADLAERGFAVRRGESFPGLGPTWIRIAVREPAITDLLGAALAELRRSRHAA